MQQASYHGLASYRPQWMFDALFHLFQELARIPGNYTAAEEHAERLVKFLFAHHWQESASTEALVMQLLFRDVQRFTSTCAAGIVVAVSLRALGVVFVAT